MRLELNATVFVYRDQIDYTVNMVLTFINERISQVELGERRLLRGPFLAKMELCNILKERNSPELEKIGKIIDIIGYYS